MRLFIILFTAVILNQASAQCPTGNVFLTGMDELNQFYADYPDCNRLDYNMYVTGEDVWTLLPLASLDTIMGNLEIIGIGLLNNLSGLSELLYVHGDVKILTNPFLSNLNGLQGLHRIGGELFISNNPSQVSLNGLNNLDVLGGLKLWNLPAISHVNALVELDSILGDMDWQTNPVLANLSGLAALEYVGGNMVIQGCGMTDLNALGNLNTIQGILNISADANLNSIGLPSLVSVYGNLQISDNDQLSNLNSLSSLDLIQGGLYLSGNANLSEILSLDQSISITDSLVIAYNPLLEVCDVTSVCEHLEGSTAARIQNNAIGCFNEKEVIRAFTITGIQEAGLSYFKVFPNPFNSTFQISSEMAWKSWEILDLSGKRIHSVSDSNIRQEDLSYLAQGTYILRIRMEDLSHSQLLVKD